MIIGIGIDVVHVSRLRHWGTIDGIFERYFHEKELADAQTRGHAKVLSLAARFAAKEAFGKALGTGLRGIALRDIIVENNHNGKPDVRLYGNARAAFERVGGKHLHVSLTHEQDNAIAVIIIEGGER